MAKAIVIAAPSSGSGKTVVTLGIAAGACAIAGCKVASAKVGPDYIDPRFHEAATGRPVLQSRSLGDARRHHRRAISIISAADADLVVIEGVMGLFDGPERGGGSTADLAAKFDLPVVLVIDCSSMAQSVAALARGFADYRR